MSQLKKDLYEGIFRRFCPQKLERMLKYVSFEDKNNDKITHRNLFATGSKVITRFFIFLVIPLLISSNVFAVDNSEWFALGSAKSKLEDELITKGAGDFIQIENIRINEESGKSFLLKKIKENDANKQVFVKEINFDHNNNSFIATLTSEKGNIITAQGQYEEMVEIPALARRLYRGEIIKEKDLLWIPASVRKMRTNTVTSSKDLIGKALTRMVSAQHPINERDITNPVVVEKGDTVNVVYRTRYIELKTIGIAQERGAIGDIIKIKNKTSGAIVLAKIAGNGEMLVNYIDTPQSPVVMQETGEQNAS